MSRITGTDAANLIEAYNSLYAPQEEVELTEEQVQEDFENWVNSLVEEGHDLSEYTWEDMYEEYLNEMGRTMTTGQATAPRPVSSPRPAPTGYNPAGGGMRGGRGSGSSPGGVRPTFQSTGGYGRYAPPSMQRPTPAAPAAPARPAAPAARPSTPTAAKPAPAATPAKPASTATTGFQLARQGIDLSKPSSAPATQPARPSLAAQAAELRAMRKASQQRIMAQGGTPATPLVQSLDLFDIVKGYLIDEGYAETEEAAAVIMANMSDEWRQSIVEGTAAIRANVPQPGQRTVSMTATGKEPAGDRLIRQAGQAISSFLGSRGVVKSEPASQRKPLVSRTVK